MGKRSRHKKVVKVWTLDEDNMEELAKRLNQPLEAMVKLLLIAQVNDRSVHVIEYGDRYELAQTAAGS